MAEGIGHHLGVSGFALTAPFEAESDRNLEAEKTEREDREARELFEKGIADDEKEAAEERSRQRYEEMNDIVIRQSAVPKR